MAIDYIKRDGVAYITLNNPAKANILDKATSDEISQAWIDMWMSNTMLVKKAMPIVSHTFVPILRLSGDKEQVDRDYAAMKSRRALSLAARRAACATPVCYAPARVT